LPDLRHRRQAVLVATIATSMLLAGSVPTAIARSPAGLDRFLHALGNVESGGRYTARNASSGAYGKYQIMPTSWRAWALRYLGNAHAKPTPANQEIVARRRVTALYRSLGEWRFVAHWWLTGSSSRNVSSWSAYARRYVAKVMAGYADPVAAAVAMTDDGSKSIAYSGSWRVARYGAYLGGRAHYAEAAGASASFTFNGRGIAWIGPLGPTRGRAQVLIDGSAVGTVDLRRAHFAAQATIFSTTWTTTGKHTIAIRVLRAPGRPVVAVDAFAVTP
jgi:hypothetical protein